MARWPWSEAMDEQAVSPPTTEQPLYAVVVVHTSLRRAVTAATEVPTEDAEDEDQYIRTFHYSVPERLRSELQIGQLVWVPFGARYLQGLVVGLDTQSPVEKTKDIDQIVAPEPVLSPVHLRLARWISSYYLAPLYRVILTMLPPGITQEVDVVVRPLVEAEPEGATPLQRQFWLLLQQHGALSLTQIARLSREPNWRSVVDQLVAHGWASKQAEIRPPTVRPKCIPVVRLNPEAPEPSWGARATKLQRAWEYLRQRPGAHAWLPLAEVAAEAGVPTEAFRSLAAQGLVELGQRQVWRDPLQGRAFVPVIPPVLTPEQEAAWRAIAADLESPAGRPFLLQGVTGSGKTEIYLRAVQRVLEQGRGAIVLVPEIALTPQTIRRFGARFPGTIAVLHSHLSPGERYDQWRRIRAGELRLVVGSRSAIFAPVQNLGLVVVDEEHEPSYKQEKTPRYHAREVAVRLAQWSGATCILGSATPMLESTYRAEQGEYVLLRLPQRIMGHRQALAEQAEGLARPAGHYTAAAETGEALYAELPPVEVVDMRAELRAGNRTIFSRALQEAITVALAAGEQIILFLNRRGTATFILCRDCGHVLKCPRCDLPLTYHAGVDDLICHHCNYKTFLPPQCPSCWSGRIRLFGSGTERVEELVRERYPQARVVRWDLDTTRGKEDHEKLLEQFIRGEADIMVGTQMIAKGLDLPRVTLVGVIAADITLNLPDLRAGERTFQLLTQVAGRAGRSILGGKVIIQTYAPHHPVIQAASRHDYAAFYERELAFRREHGYPPFSRLIQLVYAHPKAEKAQQEAERLHRQLTLKIARLGLPYVQLIGPSPAFFARLRGKARWQILIRGQDPAVLLRDMTLPLGWQVDVDPVSVL